MGVCIGADTVFTSAHVVRDDRLRYEVWGMRYDVWERDFDVDIAYMKMNNEQWTMNNICNSYRAYVWKAQLTVWQSIYIPVIRSGSLVTLTGSITSLTGTILAYDSVGRTQTLTGLILTDISLSPWDSGAPILDGQRRVIDVVHIAE
jgi:S1-C subfamily serine protease